MPIIFEPPAALLAAQSAGSLGSPSDGSGVAPNGGSQVWIAISPASADPNWGGCQVWLSFDDATYAQIGTITSRANQGVLTTALPSPPGANPDTTDTLAIDLSMSGGTLLTGSDADAQAGRTLCYVDGEFIAYGLATPTTGDAYNLTDLYRALYGSNGTSHSRGAAFARLDDNIFKYNLPSSYAGQTLYFKFASFNALGGGVQNLAALSAVGYTPAAGVVPSGLITGGDATVSPAGIITLANTGVTAGVYATGSFTVDAKGRLAAASSGTAPVTSVSAISPIASSGGVTPNISLVAGALPNGMTAATQTSGDNSTKVATDAIVQAALPVGANPSAIAGLTAANGSAATFMRSDAAPPLSQSIAPTWTGTHVWTGGGLSLSSDLSSTFPSLTYSIGSSGNLSIFARYSANSVSAGNSFLKSRSTTPGTFSQLNSNDTIFSLHAYGDTGSSWGQAGVLAVVVDTSFTSGNNPPGRFIVELANASGTTTEYFRIDHAGNISVSAGANQIADQAGNLYDANLTASSFVYSDGSSPPKLTSTAPGAKSWTPSDQSGAGMSFSNVDCEYQQIGNLVFASFYFTFPTTTSSANVAIGGLPITIANRHAATAPSLSISTGSAGAQLSVPIQNTTKFTFKGLSNTQLANSGLSTLTVGGTLVYPAS